MKTIMKQAEKQIGELKTAKLQDASTSGGKNQDKPTLNSQGEELIQRDEVPNTPFVMITINNETFGTFGQYRITETYHTKQQCAVELKKIDWNRLIQIMTLVNEIMNRKNNTTKDNTNTNNTKQ